MRAHQLKMSEVSKTSDTRFSESSKYFEKNDRFLKPFHKIRVH